MKTVSRRFIGAFGFKGCFISQKMNQQQKIVLGVLVGFAVFASLAWIARPTPTSQNVELAEIADVGLAAEEEHYDLGVISMANGIVTHKFKIKNTSSSPLQVNRMYTSCMCTTVSLITSGGEFGPMGMPGHGPLPEFKAELQPGQEAEVEIAFDPAAHGPAGVGRIARSVYLQSNGRTALELGIAAFVRP